MIEEKQDRKISAGSYDLNKFLYGGYEKDIITTIYGPAATGKTNFCLLAAISQAKKGNKIIFIDTEGGFSVERVKQIAKQDTENTLKNIFLFKPVNFQEQQQAFEKLQKQLKDKSVSLIIIDGMTMLYRLELAEARKQNIEQVKDKPLEKVSKIQKINSELAKQLRILAEIARIRQIPVIITNQVYSDFLTRKEFEAGKEKQVHMVGGDILKYWSKCIIELQNKNGKRKAILRKHRSLPEKELIFIITADGIRKRGWI